MSNTAEPSFKKLDLHIHTPHSLCYSDMSVTPEQIIEAAAVLGLDAIGVTDHNCAEGVDEMRRAASREGIAVFPGMELTMRAGHFLAIFGEDAAVPDLRGFLESCGLPSSQWGDGGVTLPGKPEDIFAAVTGRGGIVIAAHIERWPSGFLETRESRAAKMAVHASLHVSALEITVPQNRERWEEGLVRGYPRKYACIQGSDAHSPTEVGRRPFLARMESIGLTALSAAFQDRSAIVFPHEMAV